MSRTNQYYLDVTCPEDGQGTLDGHPVPWAAVCAGWVGPSGAAQIFFDDHRSLPAKYELAAKLGIRGIGPYDLEDIATAKNETWNRDMWTALRNFNQGIREHTNDATRRKTDDDAASGAAPTIAMIIVRPQAIQKIYDRTVFSEINCL